MISFCNLTTYWKNLYFLLQILKESFNLTENKKRKSGASFIKHLQESSLTANQFLVRSHMYGSTQVLPLKFDKLFSYIVISLVYFSTRVLIGLD